MSLLPDSPTSSSNPFLILPAFQSRPDVVQFAKKGAWENAWGFPTDDLPDEGAVLGWISDSDEVAFEAFFGNAFFGLRCTGPAPGTKCFAIGCIRALRRARTGEPFFPTLRRETGFEGFSSSIAFAEIGAVNAWRSCPAFRWLPPATRKVDFQLLWPGLLRSPIAADCTHPKAIEFAFEQPAQHWFGLPVSDPGPPHRLSQASLREALSIAGFDP